MIIEAKVAKSEQTIDVIIEPFDVLVDLSCDWRVSIGVDKNSPIMGGYWMREVGDEFENAYIRIRLATRDEIVQFDAFKLITRYTATL